MTNKKVTECKIMKKGYLLLGILLIGCNSSIKYYEKENTLIHIANYYIEREEYRMFQMDSISGIINHSIPIRIEIFQEKDYRNCFQFAIVLSNSNSSTMEKLPTKIVKIKDRYVFIYMHARPPLSKKHLPSELFNETERDLSDETSWQVLMCKKCLKCIVVIDNEIIPIMYIKQFNEFTCDCKCDYKKDKQKIIAEKIIIDTPDGFLPPPPLETL